MPLNKFMYIGSSQPHILWIPPFVHIYTLNFSQEVVHNMVGKMQCRYKDAVSADYTLWNMEWNVVWNMEWNMG